MSTSIHTHIRKMDQATRAILKPYFTHPSADEWIRDVASAYFTYFQCVGDDERANREAVKTLAFSLRALVPAGHRRSMDQIEDFLFAEFQRKGWVFLGGRTGPYYGPYIWKRTEKRVFDVQLPDRHERVTVFFMHEFLMRSWMHFQTYGKHGTGGWVKYHDVPWEDGLYCVASVYDMEHLEQDPVFQVSLLKHEGQHYADKAAFPTISSTDLEYRAKLVELIYYTEIRFRFTAIIREAAPSKTDPHRSAAHRILHGLSERIFGKPYIDDEISWRSIPYEKIQAESRSLLLEHTRKLLANDQSIIDISG